MAVPVLWLCGPPGVGKTAVGWAVYSELVRSGVSAAYVDVDQLGMCYPEADDDPGRHRLQARNLAAVTAGYRAAGVDQVVVSGVVDPRHGVPLEELPQVELTVCRLRADDRHLTERFLGRPGPADGLPQVLREAAALDAGTIGDFCVDTSGLTVSEVAARVLERIPFGTEAPSPILWLSGATGVGKSTVGFAIYLETLAAGVPTAYLDLDQIGFSASGGHRMRARTAGAMWRNFRRSGARAMVIVGPAPDPDTVGLYAGPLSPAEVTVCRLHAGPEELTSRILSRGQGGSWSQPGDPLVGKSVAHLTRIADQAARDAATLERLAVGHRIDTDGRTVQQVADAVLSRTAWPGKPAAG